MARKWTPRIYLDRQFPFKPQVRRLATELGVDTLAVIERLCRLWVYAHEKATPEGLVEKPAWWVDELVGTPGFAAALHKVGWITTDSTTCLIHRFDEHLSRRAVQRTERSIRDGRASGLIRIDAAFLTDSTTIRDAFVTDSRPPTEAKPEPKKKRAPAKPKEPKPKPDPTLFDRFWAAYPRRTGKGAAAESFAKYKPDEELLQKMLAAVAEQMNTDQWRKDGGQFIPYPATWLNQRRWEDDATTVRGRRGGRVYSEPGKYDGLDADAVGGGQVLPPPVQPGIAPSLFDDDPPY